ncbi:DUF4747 family protein [Aliiroseovarius crassostreae]|uniref:DUF4747 family protein n=1 Tax=Aliiroseovarius crassostreae TaxID=154981 RepID=UPI00220FEF09|nr:DUF4747 family protein [Aliiroseovarius crassostreae]UWP91614.1 DUF4747 family protein [Aliiroseovarius crassostreae]
MDRVAKFGVLNIVAHPHPAGTYRELFEVAGKDIRGVRFWGDRFATLSPISPTRNGVFVGKLATWTEIEPQSNLIEKASLNQQLLAESDVNLPEGIGFNSRVFSFAFREQDHKLFVELKNDEGNSISIGRARLAIKNVLKACQPKDIEELDVHLTTQANAVEHVLAIPQLRKLEILLDLPNPDVLSDRKRKILDQIEGIKAKRVKTEITKAAGEDRIELDPEYTAMAELAKDNGYVFGKGRNEFGDPVELNTKNYPLEIDTVLEQQESSAIATRRVAENQNVD